MLRTSLLTITIITLTLGVGACDAGLTGTPIMSPPRAAIAAAEKLNEDHEVPLENIEYISYTNEDWPNACLGLAKADEMCAQVVTPGYRVVLEADGEQYVYRTDETGQIIRQEF